MNYSSATWTTVVLGTDGAERVIEMVPNGDAFVWCPPHGMSVDDMPKEFIGVLDHIDEHGNLWVIRSGAVPNEFTRSVFRKRKASDGQEGQG